MKETSARLSGKRDRLFQRCCPFAIVSRGLSRLFRLLPAANSNRSAAKFQRKVYKIKRSVIELVRRNFVARPNQFYCHREYRSSRRTRSAAADARRAPLHATTGRQMTKESSLEGRRDRGRDSAQVFARSYKRGTGEVEGNHREFGPR